MSTKDNCAIMNFFNMDCIEGCREHIQDNSIDLIITDPPYGINGDKLHKHYNRNETFVLDGYIEIPKDQYPAFSNLWIREAERILKPGGSIYIVSGYTNLIHILNSLSQTDLAHEIREKLSSIYHFFIPIFFCIMGMMDNFSLFFQPFVIFYGLIYVIGAILGKIIGCGIPALLTGFNLRGAFRIGAGMLPRGEVTLIIAGIGLSAGVINQQIFKF